MSKAVVAVSVLISLTVGRAAWGDDKPRAIGHEEILDWLPEDSQTLFVMRGPIFQGPPAAAPIKTELDSFRYQLQFFMGVPQLDAKAADENVAKELADNPVMLAVEGSRKFRSPTGFGMMPYEGAHILVYRKNVGANMTALQKKPLRTEEIEGQRVSVIQEKMEEDLWTTYVAQIKPNVIILATNRDYLKEVMKRSAAKTKPKTRAFPVNLPEWKYVETAAPFWGLRHYDRKDGPNDPSSPLAGKTLEANVLDDQAVGFVIALKDDVADVKYLSTNKDALEIAGTAWAFPDEKATQPTVRAGAPGVAEISFPLEKNSQFYNAIFLIILQNLGHSVSL